jgi:hypothetical protein
MTNFHYVISRPDPEAKEHRARKQSQVQALVGETEAGYLAYGLGPGEDIVSITRIETHDPYKRQGCATGLIDALQAGYPDCRVVDGGGDNTNEGDAFLADMRSRGKVEPKEDG